MHVRRASHGSAPPLNCGVMRLFSVLRWFFLVPSAVAAWYFAVLISAVLYSIVVMPCRDSDVPLPEFCEASWFPLEFLDGAIVFFGIGLSAVLVVAVAAIVAPARKAHVAWVSLAAGAIVATVMAYDTGAVAEAAAAIASGVLAAIVVSRTTGSRHAMVARTSVVPNA